LESDGYKGSATARYKSVKEIEGRDRGPGKETGVKNLSFTSFTMGEAQSGARGEVWGERGRKTPCKKARKKTPTKKKKKQRTSLGGRNATRNPVVRGKEESTNYTIVFFYAGD